MAEIMEVHTILTYGTGAPGLTTFRFLPGTAGGVPADAVDAVGRVQDCWDAMKGNHPSNFVATVQGEVRVIDATDGALTGFLDGGADVVVTGTSASAGLPIASMLLLQHDTGDIHMGRRVRGRSYIGPVALNTNVAGVPTATAKSLLLTGALLLLSGATATVPVVWSRPDSPVGDPGFHSEVLTYRAAGYFAVLRSRRD